MRRLARRRFTWLAVAALLTGLLALYARGLRLDEDLLAFLPRDDARIAGHARVLEAYRALGRLRVDLGPADDRERLLRAAAAFEEALVSPLVSRVFGGVPDEKALETAAALSDVASRSLPALLPPEAVAAVMSRYADDAALEARLVRNRELLLDPIEGMGAASIVRRDPLGLEGPFFEAVRELQAVVPGARLERGRILSADGKHVLFLVEPRAAQGRLVDAEEVLALIAAAEARANAAAPGPPLRAIAVGGHRSSVENARAIKHDAWLTSILSLVCMLIVYAALFPRRWLIPLTALPLIFGGVFGLAACRLLLGSMSKIAIGFGGILLGLADDFIVHLYWFHELRARAGVPDPAASAVARIAGPTLLAGASIAAAFIALAASGFPGQRDLAVFATASLAGTLAFTLVIQPLLLPAGATGRRLSRAGVPIRVFVGLVERHEKAALLLVAAATLVLGVAATRVRFEDDPRAIEFRDPATRADEEALAARWGDPGEMALVVARGPTLDAALEENDRAYRALDGFRARGLVRAVSSIAPLLPSRATQARNRAAWLGYWEKERAGLAERLARLGPRHHYSALAFSTFLERTKEANPLPPDGVGWGALDDLLGSRIARDAQGTMVATFVRLRRDERGVLALDWSDELERSSGAVVASGHTFAVALVSLLRERLASCALLAFVVVLVLLALALRRPRHVLAAVLPLIVGLVWSLGLFTLTGTAINAVNFLIPVLTFGLAVDYVLFLASGYVRPPNPDVDEVDQAQGAVVASSTTTLTGMASLLVATHPALWSVGVVSLVGTTASLLAIFLLTPVLLRQRPRH